MHSFGRMLVLLGLSLVAMAAGASSLVDGNAAAGKKKSAACAGCHGVHGNAANPQFPTLAGQHATYLLQQLKHFKTGKRQNAAMARIVANLSLQDMKDLAVYYAKQPMQISAVANKKRVERGAEIYRVGDPDMGIPACAGCHGPSGLGNAAAAFPRIGGQNAQYLISQLKAYRAGKRSGYPKAQIMVGVARNMTNATIKAVASYIQGLRPRKESNQ